MEIITVNAVGSIRRATLSGREYIVAPVTMIVEGVLEGSKGKLFYPKKEYQKDPSVWNGMPLVGYHPTRHGMHISARDPDVLNSQGLGMVLRAKAKDSLKAEAWFDVLATQNFDRRLSEGKKILPRLLAGQPIELSTGLYTENERAPFGAQWKGKSYDFIARNYRPDHLAVLPDQQGACSIADGCGILVNEKSEWISLTNCGSDCECEQCKTENVESEEDEVELKKKEKTVNRELVSNSSKWQPLPGWAGY